MWTLMRYSFGEGVGTGTSERTTSAESFEGWRRARMVFGIVVEAILDVVL